MVAASSLELPQGPLQVVVHDRGGRTPPAAASSSRARPPGAARSARGVRRRAPAQALARSSNDGGAMNTCTASGRVSRTWRAPWTSISSTIAARGPRRARSAACRSGSGVLGVLDEVARGDPALELLGAQEVVVAPSTSPGRGARVVAETDSSRPATRSSSPLISVPLPTPGGTGDDQDRGRSPPSGAGTRRARCAAARRARRSSCSARCGSA